MTSSNQIRSPPFRDDNDRYLGSRSATIFLSNARRISTFQSTRRWIFLVFSSTTSGTTDICTLALSPTGRMRPLDRSNQYVVSLPLPFASTWSSRCSNHSALPPTVMRSAVACEHWILSRWPVDSIRLAVLTVSPNNWNLLFSPRSTPAVTGPLCRPTRNAKFPVSGPRIRSRPCTTLLKVVIHSIENLAITIAWSGLGSGNPQTATVKVISMKTQIDSISQPGDVMKKDGDVVNPNKNVKCKRTYRMNHR